MPPNRLATETSLYLRQHADNPVDWFRGGRRRSPARRRSTARSSSASATRRATGATSWRTRASPATRRRRCSTTTSSASRWTGGNARTSTPSTRAPTTLYEACFDAKYLRAAVGLADATLEHFADPGGVGFFFTADDHEPLIARTREQHDGSTPSGTSVAVTVLADRPAVGGRPTVYVCRDSACRAPLVGAEAVRGYTERAPAPPGG